MKVLFWWSYSDSVLSNIQIFLLCSFIQILCRIKVAGVHVGFRVRIRFNLGRQVAQSGSRSRGLGFKTRTGHWWWGQI